MELLAFVEPDAAVRTRNVNLVFVESGFVDFSSVNLSSVDVTSVDPDSVDLTFADPSFMGSRFVELCGDVLWCYFPSVVCNLIIVDDSLSAICFCFDIRRQPSTDKDKLCLSRMSMLLGQPHLEQMLTRPMCPRKVCRIQMLPWQML